MKALNVPHRGPAGDGAERARRNWETRAPVIGRKLSKERLYKHVRGGGRGGNDTGECKNGKQLMVGRDKAPDDSWSRGGIS